MPASASSSGGAPPTPPKHRESNHDPTVDLLLIFQAQPASVASGAKRAAKPSQADTDATLKEYRSLLRALHDVGLLATVRHARPGTGQLLVFVKAPDAVLVQAGKAESLSDYLHGLPTSLDPSSSSLSRSSSLPAGARAASQAQLFSQAERIRLVHALVTSPSARPSGKDAATAAAVPPGARGVAGAGIVPRSAEYPHLVDITALHDPDYNHDWLARWSGGKGAKFFIGIDELDLVRAHFGENISLYFGFLSFYFQALFLPSLLGFAFWWTGQPLSPAYSFLLVLWACVFVEAWRMRERQLAVRWGTLGIEATEQRRLEFRPRCTTRDEVTGEEVEVFEWWRRELRIAASLPVMVFFAALLGLTLTTMFATEVFVAKLYDGPGKAIIPQIPTILFVAVVPQIMGAWQATAASLTGWENHYSARNHTYSQTLKVFALQALVSYGALSLSAFVYIPYGQAIMDGIVGRGLFRSSIEAAVKRGDLALRSDGSGGIRFNVDPSRMANQLFAVLTTSQAIGAFTELLLPLILRKVNEWKASRADGGSSRRAGKSSSSGGAAAAAPGVPAPASEEDKFLRRVWDELDLPPYELFGDYAEMSTQFGFIVLWSVIWPLAPVMGWVNNFFELRSDAAKICLNTRRPLPVRTDSIGPWLEVLGFIAWLSAVSNSALVYLFQPAENARLPGHSVYETVMRTHLHAGHVGAAPFASPNATSVPIPPPPTLTPRSAWSFSNLLPDFLPTSGATGALVAAALVALTAEHAYAVARGGVRHVLERAVWRGSEAETALRRREWEARKEIILKAGSAGGGGGGGGGAPLVGGVTRKVFEGSASTAAAAADAQAQAQAAGGAASTAADRSFWQAAGAGAGAGGLDAGESLILQGGKKE